MQFDFDKEQILGKKDKSSIQGVDSGIRKLVNIINSNDDYYTTSSCAGRIQLIVQAKRKCDSEWLLKSHKKVAFKDIKTALKQYKEGELWFRQEAMILHVCCRTIEAANSILNIAREHGFKRSGIIAMNRRIIVEILSQEKVDTIIGINGKIVVNDKYLKLLIKIANSKLELNIKKIKNLEKEKKLFLSRQCRACNKNQGHKQDDYCSKHQDIGI
jgi:tRNA wybutosine-synthesizing protein 3